MAENIHNQVRAVKARVSGTKFVENLTMKISNPRLISRLMSTENITLQEWASNSRVRSHLLPAAEAHFWEKIPGSNLVRGCVWASYQFEHSAHHHPCVRVEARIGPPASLGLQVSLINRQAITELVRLVNRWHLVLKSVARMDREKEEYYRKYTLLISWRPAPLMTILPVVRSLKQKFNLKQGLLALLDFSEAAYGHSSLIRTHRGVKATYEERHKNGAFS